MKVVRLFDFIQFDGGSWQVVAQDGSELALKNLATGRIRRVAAADLLTDDSYLPDDPRPLPSLENVAAVERLSPGARDDVLALHRHVHEVLHGLPPGSSPGSTPKSEYDLADPLQARIEAKLTELAARGIAMTERTMFRHLADYRTRGIGASRMAGQPVKRVFPGGPIPECWL